ncbi:hypothetical protein [Dickeya zeae]|nr:hypothetical protein [Dickeya zeae]MCO7261842.1 hypothetical protein [Dickeya zeae]
MEDDELHITPFDEAALDGSGLIDETIKRRGECISLFKGLVDFRLLYEFF